MAAAPELSGQFLTLRPFEPSYLTDTYVGWLNDPKVMRYSEQRHRQHSLETCAAYVASFDTSPHLLWAIWDKSRSCHIGNISATLDSANQLADIGILIGDHTAQGHGFGQEAWSLVLEFLSDFLLFRKVTGGCMASNLAMIKLMEKSGMVPDGRRIAHYTVDDQPVDIVYFARFNSLKS